MDDIQNCMKPYECHIPYSGKVWQIESLVNLAYRLRFTKLKPSKLVVTNNNPLADLLIRQTFFRQTIEKSKFSKHSPRQTFLLYGTIRFMYVLRLLHLCVVSDTFSLWGYSLYSVVW